MGKHLIGAIAVATFMTASGCYTMVWDGCFSQAEYRLLFQDRQGNPVPGIILRVENDNGDVCYESPVDDFNEESAPVSGANGVMTFHHISTGFEFGGTIHYILFCIPVGNSSAPVRHFRFTRNGEVVYLSLIHI